MHTVTVDDEESTIIIYDNWRQVSQTTLHSSHSASCSLTRPVSPLCSCIQCVQLLLCAEYLDCFKKKKLKLLLCSLDFSALGFICFSVFEELCVLGGIKLRCIKRLTGVIEKEFERACREICKQN